MLTILIQNSTIPARGKTAPPNKEYYLQRLSELGISEAKAPYYGIEYDRSNGDLLINVFHYDGQPVEFVPVHRKERLKALRKQKTSRETHEQSYYAPFFRRRIHPSRVSNDGPKYISPKSVRPPSFPMPAVRAAYAAGIKGGVLAITEGELKGISLDLVGIETVAFGGIGMYDLDDPLKTCINRRRHSVILVGYDADAPDISTDKSDGLFTSKRAQDFYNSAVKFTEQLFDYLDFIGHDAKVYWWTPNPETGKKGVDDLLGSLADPLAAAHDLAMAKDGDLWKIKRMFPTTCSDRLKEYHALGSASEFHNFHRKEIGSEPFKFRGLTYQVKHGTMTMTSDPFAFGVNDNTPVRVKKYLGDQAPLIDNLIDANRVLAIAAPTGSGKTTFLVDYAKRYGLKMVLATHTVNLCKQLAKEHSLYAVHGKNTIGRAADAAAAQIVVATYETVAHLPDLPQRFLVIDEAQNLVNHYGAPDAPFRADTVTRLMWQMSHARKTVLLSGTMPMGVVKAFDLPLLTIEQAQPKKIRVHQLTAKNSAPKAVTAALISQLLEDISSRPGKVHFALYNSTKQVNTVRKYLIDGGYLKNAEIQAITRQNVNAGEVEGMNDIISKERVRDGVKIVLSTSIIAEGVNIKNVNLGRVYAVGCKCVDTIRQYVARFRDVGIVDLFLILPPEKEPGYRFELGSGGVTEAYLHRHRLAEQSARRATLLCKGEAWGGERKPVSYPDIMIDPESECFLVDRLSILAGIRDQQISAAPASYIIGRLLDAPGFELYTDIQAPLREGIEGDLKATEAAIKSQCVAALSVLQNELKLNTSLVIASLICHYQQSGNRRAVSKLKRLAGVSAEAPASDVQIWLTNHGHLLRRYSDLRELIRRAAQLVFAGVPNPASWLLVSRSCWAKEWKRTKVFYEIRALEKRKRGQKIPAAKALDIRARQFAQKRINEITRNSDGTYNNITDADLAKVMRDIRGRDSRIVIPDKKGRKRVPPCLVTITKGRAVGLAAVLFDLNVTRHGTKKVISIISPYGEGGEGACLADSALAFRANPALLLTLSNED